MDLLCDDKHDRYYVSCSSCIRIVICVHWYHWKKQTPNCDDALLIQPGLDGETLFDNFSDDEDDGETLDDDFFDDDDWVSLLVTVYVTL